MRNGFAQLHVVARRGSSIDRLVVAALAASVLVTHDVGRMLSQSFWTDEGWVAVTTRYPLGDLARVTSSTPIGLSFLLRLVPFGGPERMRLVPLAFAAGAVVAGYTLARGLRWPNRWASVGAGFGAAYVVLMSPAMLVRNDLKQYTADAALALIVLTLTSRVEKDWSRRNLGLLTGAIVGGMLFSHTTAFVGVAAFVALIATQALRRAWRTCLETSAAAAAAALGMAVVYEAWDARAVVPGLTDYWRPYYLPVGTGFGHFFTLRWKEIHEYLGLGPLWLAVPLVLAGVATITRLGRPATALAIGVLFVEMPVVSMLHRYPYLDVRTSTFLLVVSEVVAAIGVVGIGVAVRRWLRVWGAVGLAVAAVVALTIGSARFARTQTVPLENVAQQVDYVNTHRAPGDVIVVNGASTFSFAYYWRPDQPTIEPSRQSVQKYLNGYPRQPGIVMIDGRTCAAVSGGLATGLRQIAAVPGTKLWLIRTHVNTNEAACWYQALAGRSPTVVPNGPPGLVLVYDAIDAGY
ncbi:MAG: hypothetical protein QOG80_1878 [Pseudonocardiales bacterium]|nr:hypothetical protein [Pseudonocardiales bacterium]